MATSPEVLIVEDEPVVLKVAGKALSVFGISYAESQDFESAASQMSKRSFKLILTDLKLPGNSGFEVLKLAAKSSPPPQVVTITGYATIDNALESFRLGSFDFLPKPFDIDELIGVVHRGLRFFDQQQEAPDPTSMAYPDADLLRLGRHSWAALDADGTATLGAAETLAGMTGPLVAIERVGSESQTIQGMYFCKLVTANGRAHQVRAPLSGRILTGNPALDSDSDLVNRAPFTEGWLARVIPSDLDKEVSKLGRRYPSAAD